MKDSDRDEALYVIGSGPAGIACATGLLQRGFGVRMLDAGVRLEAEKQEIVDRLSMMPGGDWPPGAIHEIKGKMSGTAAGIALKTIYGSTYPYEDASRFVPVTVKRATVRTSLAQGGLSTVWGAAILPYREPDLVDWPIGHEEIARYYNEVLSMMPYAAETDELASLFPLYADHHRPLRESAQAHAALAHLRLHRGDLNERGIFFGKSRLAVGVTGAASHENCYYCGLCFSGCPGKLIYSAAYGLADLMKLPRFSYLGDVVVEQVQELENRVIVSARSRKSEGLLKFDAARVFLACGALSSTRIILNSMRRLNHSIPMKDSGYFLLPVMLHQNVKSVDREKLHSLAQVFIEILDQKISEHTVHLQLYTYAEVYQDAIQTASLGVPLAADLMKRMLLGRLSVIQGYFHSADSPEMRVTLLDDPARTLRIERADSGSVTMAMAKLIVKLWRNRHALGFTPVLPMLRFGTPGRGFHYGGTLPMRRTPGPLECDVSGRPQGFDRIHIVDTCVFPSIPATTITLSEMANAYRIASTYTEGGRSR